MQIEYLAFVIEAHAVEVGNQRVHPHAPVVAVAQQGAVRGAGFQRLEHLVQAAGARPGFVLHLRGFQLYERGQIA